MKHIAIVMGQAVAADLTQFWLGSTDFSSCTGIIVCNKLTSMGALYHYPAEALTRGGAAGDKASRILASLLRHLGLSAKNAWAFRMQGNAIEEGMGMLGNRGDAQRDMKAIDDYFKHHGLKIKALPRGGSIRVGIQNKEIVTVNGLERGTKVLTRAHGGAKGRELQPFSGLKVRIFGEDQWTPNEPAPPPRVLVQPVARLRRSSTQDSLEAEELFGPRTSLRNVWQAADEFDNLPDLP